MNIKRGLKRIWLVLSVLWVVWGVYYEVNDGSVSIDPDTWVILIVTLVGWWGLLYSGFWIGSGFTNNKKKDETNET